MKFSIGIYKPQYIENVGTICRSAYQLGVDEIFVIGGKFFKQSSDTIKTWTKIPIKQFNTFDSFLSYVGNQEIVCIENGGEQLPEFEHPTSACYILGNEGSGLPKHVLKLARVVEIPYKRVHSYNVAVAGSIVLYDRVFSGKKLI